MSRTNTIRTWPGSCSRRLQRGSRRAVSARERHRRVRRRMHRRFSLRARRSGARVACALCVRLSPCIDQLCARSRLLVHQGEAMNTKQSPPPVERAPAPRPGRAPVRARLPPSDRGRLQRARAGRRLRRVRWDDQTSRSRSARRQARVTGAGSGAQRSSLPTAVRSSQLRRTSLRSRRVGRGAAERGARDRVPRNQVAGKD